VADEIPDRKLSTTNVKPVFRSYLFNIAHSGCKLKAVALLSLNVTCVTAYQQVFSSQLRSCLGWGPHRTKNQEVLWQPKGRHRVSECQCQITPDPEAKQAGAAINAE
jgi:hypothetical protein